MYTNIKQQKTFYSTGTGGIEPGRKSVVFLHGAALDHTVWVLPARHFARHGYNVYAFDFPGHGRSGGELCKSIDEFADWLASAMDELDIEDSAVIGHSMGSLIALNFAARYPHKLRSLALLGTSTPMAVADQLLTAARGNHHDAIDMANTWSHSSFGLMGGNEIPGMCMTMGGQRLLERSKDDVFFTDLNAPMGRLIAIDISNPKEENWEEIIPERNHALREVHLTSGYFLCHYLKDISSEVVLYQTTGEKIEKLDFPKNGTISSISTKPESSQLFFSFSNYIRPSEIFEYDLSVKQLKSIWSQSVPGFNADEFTSKQAFYKSKDGTLIPMFISHLNGIALNNDNPLLLYGYGGFDIPILPNFSTKYFSWMKMGGIVAVANLRGGGEYGEKWHRQGMLHNKQNVFDDFAAAAEYLHQEGYSQPSKTVIEGRSNGGLLVGASLLQRPELFGATLPGVGVMDMLRFNKFTIGWAWESDYGSPEIEDDFKVLIKYSPYHNIKPEKCYPTDHFVPFHGLSG
jgi:alpha-beta hydrolase superfamily lysophospholipase